MESIDIQVKSLVSIKINGAWHKSGSIISISKKDFDWLINLKPPRIAQIESENISEELILNNEPEIIKEDILKEIEDIDSSVEKNDFIKQLAVLNICSTTIAENIYNEGYTSLMFLSIADESDLSKIKDISKTKAKSIIKNVKLILEGK